MEMHTIYQTLAVIILSGVTLAEENGGHMVTIESEQENEFVFHY